MNLLERRRGLLAKLITEQITESTELFNVLATTEIELNIQDDKHIYATVPLLKDTTYKLSFDYEYTVTENNATTYQQVFRVGSYATFQNAQIVYKGTNAGVTGTFNGSFEKELVVTSDRAVGQSIFYLESTTTILVGTYKFTNLSLVEVK